MGNCVQMQSKNLCLWTRAIDRLTDGHAILGLVFRAFAAAIFFFFAAIFIATLPPVADVVDAKS